MREVCLLFLLFLASPALADLKSCAALFAATPSALGGHRIERTYNLEERNKGYGFQVGYETKRGNSLSIVYYDGQMRRIGNKAFFQEFQDVAVLVASLKAQGLRKPGKGIEVALSETALTDSVPMMTASMRNPAGNSKSFDGLAMSNVNHCMIKLRYTEPGTHNDARFKKIVEAFARHLQSQAK